MKKAVIFYNSKTGITRKYANQISTYIASKGIDVETASIIGYKAEMLENADYVFLGCWTSGLFVMLQKPERVWKEFAAKLPNMPKSKLALFTTYKVLTGSMFRNMYKHLKNKFGRHNLELKSRDGSLSDSDQEALDQFLS